MDYTNIVLFAGDYNKIDGYKACLAKPKSLSLEQADQSQFTEIVAKIWQGVDADSLCTSAELPLHQVLDLTIFACQAILYFQDAYRFPKLYDPENLLVEQIGLQGSAMSVSVCTDNPMIDKDIQKFSKAIADNSEIIGERLRTLSRLMKEMGY
ncbi:MAG: hypothetical protein K0R69_78 [Clostridia bacterium]|nr:hypothetical protein [Clostridia bacterium]